VTNVLPVGYVTLLQAAAICNCQCSWEYWIRRLSLDRLCQMGVRKRRTGKGPCPLLKS
jgi:hypothetical protein